MAFALDFAVIAFVAIPELRRILGAPLDARAFESISQSDVIYLVLIAIGAWTWLSGSSIGKQMMGLVIVRKDGSDAALPQCWARGVCKLLYLPLFGLGTWVIELILARGKRRELLYDVVCGTRLAWVRGGSGVLPKLGLPRTDPMAAARPRRRDLASITIPMGNLTLDRVILAILAVILVGYIVSLVAH